MVDRCYSKWRRVDCLAKSRECLGGGKFNCNPRLDSYCGKVFAGWPKVSEEV